MEADSKQRGRGPLPSGAAGVIACLVFGLVIGILPSADAANFRTQNFLVQAPDPGLAQAVGQAAEKFRHDLAVYWTGRPLPNWPTPCPIRVISGPNLAAQGVTTYNPRPVSDFQMEVVGTPERILDSVLPHEVTHTVLATHFGRPLPRWADEGICTTVEHESERNKHEAKLREFLRTRRGIAMNQLFLLTEYPSDVLPMYAQGYSVCQFLIAQKDPRTFITFLQDYMQYPSWTANVKKHYGYDSLAELQQYWLQWVTAGSGPVDRFVKNAPASLAAPTNSLANAPTNSLANAPTNSLANAPANSLANAPAAGVPTASGPGGGWYQRQREQAVAANPRLAAAPTAVNALVPPSIRDSGRYQVSQPQPEMRMSRRPSVDAEPLPIDLTKLGELGPADPAAPLGEMLDWTRWADGSPRYR